MITVAGCLAVQFPLIGEWTAFHTPADHVPSHGTHQLAQTYAYDFLRIDWSRKGYKFHRRSAAYYELFGVRLDECYGWADPVVAPFAGEVLVAADGWPERRRVHFVRDFALVLKNALTADASAIDLRSLLGNHVILRADNSDAFALMAHLRCGSVAAHVGSHIGERQVLGQVGHSGNSTAPHLHFQLMDGPDLRVAKGLPCAFRSYEVFRAGVWETVENGVPGKRERVRHDA